MQDIDAIAQTTAELTRAALELRLQNNRAEELLQRIAGERVNVVVGIGAGGTEAFEDCIVIGHKASATASKSTVVASGPNNYIHPDSNINFAHVLEASSETKDVTFYGCVVSQTGLYVGERLEIAELDICDTCDLTKDSKRTAVGFQWDGCGHLNNICLDCIRDVVIAYRAKESWDAKHGNLQTQINMLHSKIFELTNAQNGGQTNE